MAIKGDGRPETMGDRPIDYTPKDRPRGPGKGNHGNHGNHKPPYSKNPRTKQDMQAARAPEDGTYEDQEEGRGMA